MIRPNKGLAFVMAVLLLLGGGSALAQNAGEYTAAELSILLTTYLNPSGENYGKPLPEWIKAYFNLGDVEYAADPVEASIAPRQEAEPVPVEQMPEEAPVPEETPLPEEAPVPEETPLPEEAPLPEPTPLTSRVVPRAEETAPPKIVHGRLAAYEPPLIAEDEVEADILAQTEASPEADGSAGEALPSAESEPSDEELPASARAFRASAEETQFEMSDFEPLSGDAEAAEAEGETTYVDETASGAEAAPEAGVFSMNPLNFLDTEITGTGMPGAEIAVIVSNEEIKTTVGADGLWLVTLPDWLFLMEGSEVWAAQTPPAVEGGETAQPEQIMMFVGRKQSVQPSVGDLDSQMAVFSGTGVPNARISVVWPDGSLSVFEPVMLTGYWGVEAGGKQLQPGDTVTVIQQEGSLLPSEPRTVPVVERSPQPDVVPPRPGDTQITGTGISGASISILSNAGFNGSALLSGDATQWTYTLPEGLALSAGDVIRLYQKVLGRTQSDWLEITVAP